MTIKERLHIHKQAYPYFLLTLGLFFGLGIAIDWDITISGIWDISFKAKLETEKSGWDIAASIGSMFAGLGTVGLLAFGWVKSNEWLNKIHEEKRLEQKIDLVSGINEGAWKINIFIKNQFIIEKGSFGHSDFMEITSKLRMQLDLFRVFGSSEESLCSDIENKLEDALRLIGVLFESPDTTSFNRRKALSSVSELVQSTQAAHSKVLQELRTL